MKLIRFRRLDNPVRVINGIRITIWEIALDEQDLMQKLDGGMAEVIMPAKPWYEQLWVKLFPMVEVNDTLN